MVRNFPIWFQQYSARLMILLAAFCFVFVKGAWAQANFMPLEGRDNPVLAFNLSPANDWTPGMQFIDLMKSARPWVGHLPGRFGGQSFEQLEAEGVLDENGWVRHIPDHLESIGTAFNWTHDLGMASYRRGRYHLTFDGSGTISFEGDAQVISQRRGHIVFENAKGHTWRFKIIATDPGKSGDYIRNISVVSDRHVALHEAGAVFNPDWLVLIADARQLRFMDWGATNHSPLVSWDQRPRVDRHGRTRGLALEHMVRLANEVGAEPWFTMPHQADAQFIRNYAEYVRDHMDPRLTIWVEWSNEVWNGNFAQYRWVLEQSGPDWGREAHPDYSAKKAVEMGLIWRDVFQGRHQNRLQLVLSTQTSSQSKSLRLLEAARWRVLEPDAYVAPASVFDALAVTSYFGGRFFNQEPERAEMLALMRDGSDLSYYITQKLRVGERGESSIGRIVRYLKAQKDVAEAYGLDLIAYEGGQHLHAALRKTIDGIETSQEEIDQLHALLAAYVRGPEMAEFYQNIWAAWEQIGDGPFMQYTEVSRPGRSGSWGLYNGLFDETPRSAMVERLARERAPWWDAQPNDAYLQGGVFEGTAKENQLIGTKEEDYILAGSGADMIFASPGRDGINGGPGHDSVIYTGVFNDYVISPATEGQGVQVVSSQTFDTLIQVEEIVFDDRSVMLSP